MNPSPGVHRNRNITAYIHLEDKYYFYIKGWIVFPECGSLKGIDFCSKKTVYTEVQIFDRLLD